VVCGVGVHVPIVNGMTNSAISVAKYANEMHQAWHNASVDLKASMTRSLGPTLAGTLGPPPMVSR
jgi:hypothetical protein